MKKALELLYQYQQADEIAGGYMSKSIEEAIKELEDFKNRSCENCKYNKEQDNDMIFCDKVACLDGSKMMWHSFTKDFSCKNWESR